ncbi:hypothetical protein GQ43DRAFT_428637 [Delitschia confertaspora ATCC 74209]|uniref:Uncharacterized protein n=1 Tax=Delitschia confertaspora ATCC 74209 TaxID=1513339 RepID=A0A9P4MZ13_9PLEO|nr:hypothetical protein GQ43DRAFT_428637 [Delitschia confertaspora ATCC 74209]
MIGVSLHYPAPFPPLDHVRGLKRQFQPTELDDIYEFAINLGKRAGMMLIEAAMMSMGGGQMSSDVEGMHVEKDNAVDLVTQTDEGRITFTPRFIGEEAYSKCSSRDYLIDDSPQRLALIRKPIPPTPVTAPKDRRWRKGEGNLEKKVESFVNMVKEHRTKDEKGRMVHGVRSLGSATLNLAWTAMGSVYSWWKVDAGSDTDSLNSRDVAAGIAILQEADGLVTTANPPKNFETAPIEEIRLESRLYLAVRPDGPSSIRTGRQGQERTVREVWRRVRGL